MEQSPVMRELSKEEVEEDYELNIGKVIVECINKRSIDPMAVPGIVVKNMGPLVEEMMLLPPLIMPW